MTNRKTIAIAVAAVISGTLTTNSQAGGVTFRDGDKYIKLGGRVQLQYHLNNKGGGNNTDDIFFRRLRPYIEGSVHPGWKGKFQWDMGGAKGNDEFAIKDAFMQYTAYKNMAITLGNAYTQFSREDMNSSNHLQSVERSFVGDHNYGSPERNAGLHITGNNQGKQLVWGVDLAQADIDPDANRLDFDTPVNRNTDFNQGWMINGRMDYYPMGYFKMSQGDFSGQQRVALGLAAYSWSNDDDNNLNTNATTGKDMTKGKPDVSTVNAIELSAAYRGYGLSADAEYNTFNADTVDGAFSGGLYKNGGTTLNTYAIKGGYMVIPAKLEVIADYQGLDADNYTDTWTRSEIGVNWFVAKQDIKFQLTYRLSKHVGGITDANDVEVFGQAQHVF